MKHHVSVVGHQKRKFVRSIAWKRIVIIILQCIPKDSSICERCSKLQIPSQICVRERYASQPIFSKCNLYASITPIFLMLTRQKGKTESTSQG